MRGRHTTAMQIKVYFRDGISIIYNICTYLCCTVKLSSCFFIIYNVIIYICQFVLIKCFDPIATVSFSKIEM